MSSSSITSSFGSFSLSVIKSQAHLVHMQPVHTGNPGVCIRCGLRGHKLQQRVILHKSRNVKSPYKNSLRLCAECGKRFHFLLKCPHKMSIFWVLLLIQLHFIFQFLNNYTYCCSFFLASPLYTMNLRLRWLHTPVKPMDTQLHLKRFKAHSKPPHNL